ncbi:MAG: succinate dehydrogenase cytochrome b558 subunit [Bacillota bacterium]|nr:succinate dehydrogenase cytochrome b558 subunit [Bacillota bacterium]
MSDNNFLLRKLHSLSGVLPIGLFLIFHITINATVLRGSEAYHAAIAVLHSIPMIWAAEIFIIAVPLLFHALYGIYIVYLAKNNTLRYNYYRNWAFYLQRITAVITLIFVVIHVYGTVFDKLVNGAEVGFNMMSAILASPLMLVFYLIGIISAFYHFANGLWTFFITWGITIGPVSQRYSYVICMGLFLILNVTGIMALLAFVK